MDVQASYARDLQRLLDATADDGDGSAAGGFDLEQLDDDDQSARGAFGGGFDTNHDPGPPPAPPAPPHQPNSDGGSGGGGGRRMRLPLSEPYLLRAEDAYAGLFGDQLPPRPEDMFDTSCDSASSDSDSNSDSGLWSDDRSRSRSRDRSRSRSRSGSSSRSSDDMLDSVFARSASRSASFAPEERHRDRRRRRAHGHGHSHGRRRQRQRHHDDRDSLVLKPCFGCKWSSMPETGDPDHVVPGSAINQLISIWETQLGFVAEEQLAKMCHEYFKEEILKPSRKRARRQPGHQRIPNWRTRDIYEHFMFHSKDPRLWILQRVNMWKQTAKVLDELTFMKNLGVISPAKDFMKMNMEVDKHVTFLLKQKVDDMLFYNKDSQIDMKAIGGKFNPVRHFDTG